LCKRRDPKPASDAMPPESSRLGVVGRPSHERARGPRNLGRSPIRDPRDGRLDGGLGGRAARSNGEREHPERRGPPYKGRRAPDLRDVRTRPRALHTLGRGARLHQPKGVARGDIWAQDVPSRCTSAAGLAAVRLPGGFGCHQNWTCRSPQVMVLLRILRRHCEGNGIYLGLQYIPSALNIWADKLSRSSLTSDWALTPSSLAQIRKHLPHHHNITLHSQFFARRDTVAPGVCHFQSPTGTGSEDPAGKPLPPLDGQTPWPTEMGLTFVTPTPAQAGLVLRHLRQAPSDTAVVVPDWPAQPWHQLSMRAAATTISLAGPVWRRARRTEKAPYCEDSPWAGRLLVFNRRPPATISGRRGTLRG
jgi:hypothetical protein